MTNGAHSPFPQDSTWTDTYLLILGIFAIVNVGIFILDMTLWQGGLNVIAFYNRLVDYFGALLPSQFCLRLL